MNKPKIVEQEGCCPICVERLDEEDKRFFACPCQYQVCMFCVKRMMTEFDNRCPGCRRKYNEDNFKFKDENDKDYKFIKPKRTKKKNSWQNSDDQSVYSTTSKTCSLMSGNAAADLSNIRIIQPNILYGIGVSPSIANDALLKSNKFFGQYGKILKLMVGKNEKSPGEKSPRSVYITYANPEEATAAIRAVNGLWFGGVQLKCTYGTTKYCLSFIKGNTCTNSECLYLHKIADQKCTLTKEQIQAAGRINFPDPPKDVPTEPPNDDKDASSWNYFPPKGSDATWNPKIKTSSEVLKTVPEVIKKVEIDDERRPKPEKQNLIKKESISSDKSKTPSLAPSQPGSINAWGKGQGLSKILRDQDQQTKNVTIEANDSEDIILNDDNKDFAEVQSKLKDDVEESDGFSFLQHFCSDGSMDAKEFEDEVTKITTYFESDYFDRQKAKSNDSSAINISKKREFKSLLSQLGGVKLSEYTGRPTAAAEAKIFEEDHSEWSNPWNNAGNINYNNLYPTDMEKRAYMHYFK